MTTFWIFVSVLVAIFGIAGGWLVTGTGGTLIAVKSSADEGGVWCLVGAFLLIAGGAAAVAVGVLL